MNLLPDREKDRGGWVASIIAHAIFFALLIWVLALPYPLSRLFSRNKGESIPVERISFLRLPDRGVTTPGKSGGDGRPVAPRHEERLRYVPVPSAPTNLVPNVPSPLTRGNDDGGSGAVVGRGGATQGVVPSYHDSPVWSTPSGVVSAPRSSSEKLDSTLASFIKPYNDSVAAYYANHKLERGDWTFEKDGKKYGLDPSGLHLGNITIPSALLPHFQGNNADRNAQARAIARMNQDVQEHAQMAMNEDEFREAVRRIRERKEREKKEGTQVLTP